MGEISLDLVTLFVARSSFSFRFARDSSFSFFCSAAVSRSGYAPRYSSVEDPTFSLHGSLGFDPNLDNSVFEDQSGAPRALFDEDERQRDGSPEKLHFGGHQRGPFVTVAETRAARFFFVCTMYQSGWENILNDHKITKCPYYIPSGRQMLYLTRIYRNIFHSKVLQNIPKLGFLV
jgi:hypothetical protein